MLIALSNSFRHATANVGARARLNTPREQKGSHTGETVPFIARSKWEANYPFCKRRGVRNGGAAGTLKIGTNVPVIEMPDFAPSERLFWSVSR